MIYRFRVILDAHEDVFRDLEIDQTATMEDFHNAITQSFGFGGQEMASFYVSDPDWLQGEEISLFGMEDDVRVMSETTIDEVVSEEQTRLIYIYDFLSMWTFLVELAEIAEPIEGTLYPNLMFAHGEIPDEAPDKEFIAENIKDDDALDDLDFDPEDYENLDFDENWN
ncbi:MAG: plasmid pRiA4b ORF-3 family protein [Flavobacteriia bacterium]|nr:plasmid pRiA4b ORF-3 family protein [Flavobacteriia bacterium]